MDSLLSIVIYAIICFVSFIGSLLYFNAYKEMKRTPIIGNLALLLFTIFIDGCFWLIMEYYRYMNGGYINVLIQPLSLVIIKSILAIGLVLFIYTSVKTPTDCKEKVLKKITKW